MKTINKMWVVEPSGNLHIYGKTFVDKAQGRGDRKNCKRHRSRRFTVFVSPRNESS